MSTGTGTRAAAPYAVTAGELLDEVRAALGDVAGTTWADGELLGFVGEAVREYSQHLPRASEATLAAVAGERRYALPGDATAVLSVEYPADREPPACLYRRRRKSAGFAADRHYDVLPSHDLTAPPLLLLSFDPEAGETLTVRYLRPHAADLSAGDYLTVPAEHHHVLLQYVLFAAARRQQAGEQAAPTNNSSLLMGQLAANTRRLELAYLNALNRILYQRLGEGEIVGWLE
ncbi:MAG: hypothetical protein KIS95_08125 [Anaerolineae bacterium]|uniref:phage adaptor protein n=1 Tax=Promineifilum sp. TaxID=2664178 RepID=UPI001DE6EB48|nr:hypothetical protein [Anaerolineales bacterium]MCB8934760.1 hypothetical protein [Promineifilum sp.]MCO5181532.1 hypothetical protein [Promineifilum sp.]MCW5847179.1 hypothetical protein [Anaerolineae bacterium]